MPEPCVVCGRKLKAIAARSVGCSCYAHKGCLQYSVNEVALRRTLECPDCGNSRKLPPQHLAQALRKVLPLKQPMSYMGRRGYSPGVDRTNMKHPLETYQQQWEQMIDEQLLLSPEWLRKPLFRARKKKVVAFTEFWGSKWD